MSQPQSPNLVEGDAEVELVPSGTWSIADETASGGQSAFSTDVDQSAHVALVAGTMASLGAETHSLLRRRLLGAAVFLAATSGFLLFWIFLSDNPGTLTAEGSRFSLRVGLLALRCLLTAGVAGLLASEVSLSRKQLRVVEYVLFLGMTALVMASHYFVGLDLIHRGPEFAPVILAFTKDAVIQMMALMLIYGTLIPNPPKTAVWVLVAMFVGPVAAGLFLKSLPEAAPVVALIRTSEETGSNILFLGIGAVLALYGSYILNSLRAELHEAKRFGQYQLRQKLGAGGMGEVYLAEHQLLKRPCALKLIHGDMQTNWVALERFEREVQSAARLSHPNVIEIYDYGHTDDGTFYYVMEYLPGLSLDDMVRQYGPLPLGAPST